MSIISSLVFTTTANNSRRSHSDDGDPYGYTPTRYVCYIFVCLFGVSAFAHLGQAIWFKRWFMLYTAALCGIGEAIGWIGRLLSSYNLIEHDAFMIQITCTIISPTFLVAANFIILSTIIRHLGPQYSRICPRLYTIIFVSCDVVALIVQGTGGGIASAADDDKGSSLGANIMLGGIVFQLASIVVYTACAAEFGVRYMLKRPISGKALPNSALVAVEMGSPNSLTEVQNKEAEGTHSETLYRVKIMGCALAFSTLFILIRSIYRTIELANGWNGRIIQTELYFNVLDGAMVVLAIYTLNFIHPAYFLPKHE